MQFNSPYKVFDFSRPVPFLSPLESCSGGIDELNALNVVGREARILKKMNLTNLQEFLRNTIPNPCDLPHSMELIQRDMKALS